MFYQQSTPILFKIEDISLTRGNPTQSLLQPLFGLSPLAVLLLGGICAFILAYLFTFGVIAVSRRAGWLDLPGERRVHKLPVPRLGGVAIFLSFVVTSATLYVTMYGLQQKEVVIYWLFLLASLLIVAVHVYDDVKGLKPLSKLIAQTLSVLIILGPFNGRFNGVLLFGFSNPFRAISALHEVIPWFRHPELTLFIDHPDITWLAIPAVIFTWFWMVGMMNTVNFIDGLDGLATGVVAITGIFITIISWTLGQQSIAILAAIFTGATLGFLPHNWNPAKIFMGDTGSQFLGLALAVLSIMGGAKIALALMVLGIPILDVAVVAINRIRRGQHPLHYDKTHLHHRFLATGLSVRQICYVMYGLTIIFGILAIDLPRIYKPLGLLLVGATMTVLIVWMDYRQRQRGVHIKLDGPDPTPKTGGMNISTEEKSAPSSNYIPEKVKQ
ncbi:MAG: MraY family glycosyltransferase [Ktedonobacteraceae bacterium]